ncbi:MAG: hypothetical protein PHP74_00350 [Candidatus Gracilibacteria bacterium]|nr:hypothetical protein [Candidatus Gracilibacteria bacterium]
MFTHFIHSHNQQLSILKASRLIYFAESDGQKAPPKLPKKKKLARPTQANQAKPVELHKELTENQESRIRKLGLSADQFKGSTKLDSRIIDKLYKNDTLRDGTYEKDPSNPHFLLMKALADGKFRDGGKLAPRFLEAIEGGKNEKTGAVKILKEMYLKLPGTPITKEEQSKYLAALEEEKTKDVIQSAREEAVSALATVETATETADTKSAITGVAREVLEKSEASEGVEKVFMKIGNFEVEAPREGLMKELGELAEQYRKLSQRYVNAYKECEKAAEELQNPIIDSSKKEALTTKIHNLEQEKAIIEAEMKKLKERSEKAKEEYDLCEKRNLKMLENFKSIISETGIDMLTAKKLRRWLFEKSSISGEENSSLEMGGVQSSSETGLSKKVQGNIEVKRVFFEPLELSENIPKEGDIKEAIGQMMIEFEDETGQKSTVSYVNFIRMVDAEEVHEEVAEMQELNAKIAEETHYKTLEQGDAFEAEVVEGFDEKGEIVYGKRKFSVTKIESQNGETFITLDTPVTKTPKEKLAATVSSALYFDRVQQEFPAGEFAKFLKQYNFKRVCSPEEDMQRILDNSAEHQKRRLFELGLPIAGIAALQLPKTPDSAQEITAYSDTGEEMRGRIINKGKDDKGFPRYTLEKFVPNDETDLEVLNAKKIPEFEGLPVPPELKNRDIRIERQNVAPASFMAMADKGNIGPASLSDSGGEIEASVPDATAKNSIKTPSDMDEVPDTETLKKNAAREPKIEALPYSMVHKEGGADFEQRGFLQRFWDDTRVLSLSDLWAMGKSMYDYYQRRWDRKQKDKYSTIGTELPFFGTEMRRIQQSAENEEVNQFKDSFAQKGIFEIEERLVNTKNKDELKACIIDLAGKGQMRWDNIDFWKNLNSFVDDPSKLVPIPSNGDPATIVDDEGRTGTDYLQGAIDSLWGESTYDGWVSEDKGKRQSGARSWYEKGKEVEILEGGHAKVLENALRKHRNGEYVDPHQFEGLILHMIEAGKADMQDKLYYIVAGAVAENADGKTILSFDRVAHINSEMLAKFPMLEYMTASPLRPDGKRHKWTKDDYKRFLAFFEKEVGPNHCQPTKEVDHFLWKYIVPSYEVETRINKNLRNADGMDHDDMFAYLPPASSNILENACRTVGGGGKHLLTMEGYVNATPGFSQYFKSLAHFGNGKRIAKALQSYTRYEAIMMNKWRKDDNSFARMDSNTLIKKPVASDIPPIVFFNELNGMMRNIAAAYGDQELIEAVELIQTDTRDWDIVGNPDHKAKQNRIQNALVKFDDLVKRVISRDDGSKAIQVISQANLEGMDYRGAQTDYNSRAGDPAAVLDGNFKI